MDGQTDGQMDGWTEGLNCLLSHFGDYHCMTWTTLHFNPKKTKSGQEPLELLLVFNAHPSQLSLESQNYQKFHLNPYQPL